MNTTVKRTIVGIAFLVVMVGSLLLGRLYFNTLFLIIASVMMWEFLQITMGETNKPVQRAAIVVGVFAFVLVGLHTGAGMMPVKWLSLILPALLLMMVFMIFRHAQFKEYAYVFTALLYIGLPLALSHFVVSSEGVFDGKLMLAFFILIWSSDTGAYCFGMLLGQKLWPAKLCPTISPKKSWAGAVGGMVSSLLAAWILMLVGWLPFPVVHVLVMAALMNVLGVFGDLFESLWKRQFGVKDSGNILPGHGGLLDRFDSSLFAIPTGYVYLLLNGLV